jgi:hypothetical protein
MIKDDVLIIIFSRIKSNFLPKTQIIQYLHKIHRYLLPPVKYINNDLEL